MKRMIKEVARCLLALAFCVIGGIALALFDAAFLNRSNSSRRLSFWEECGFCSMLCCINSLFMVVAWDTAIGGGMALVFAIALFVSIIMICRSFCERTREK